MCAMAAATEHRMTALVVTQSFVSALLWAARHACQGAQRRRQQHTARQLCATQPFDNVLLWKAQARLSMRATAAASACRVPVLLVTHSFDSALL
jgi:hypothetical protein